MLRRLFLTLRKKPAAARATTTTTAQATTEYRYRTNTVEPTIIAELPQQQQQLPQQQPPPQQHPQQIRAAAARHVASILAPWVLPMMVFLAIKFATTASPLTKCSELAMQMLVVFLGFAKFVLSFLVPLIAGTVISHRIGSAKYIPSVTLILWHFELAEVAADIILSLLPAPHTWTYFCQAFTFAILLLFVISHKPPPLRLGLRHCPSCSVPIEKNGGCENMICRCGAHFKWSKARLVVSLGGPATAQEIAASARNELDAWLAKPLPTTTTTPTIPSHTTTTNSNWLRFSRLAPRTTSVVRDECAICFDRAVTHSLSCGHSMCGDCCRAALGVQPICPWCKTRIVDAPLLLTSSR